MRDALTREGALKAPQRISLWKFFKRIASGAPLANPDQTGLYSELDEASIITDIPGIREALSNVTPHREH